MGDMVVGQGSIVFLDMDGCLVDSSRAIPAAMNRALLELGLPRIEPTEIHRLIGPPLEIFAERLMERVGAPHALAARFSEAYLAEYGSGMVAESSVYDGIPAALDAMSRDARLAVVTLKRQTLAERLLEALDLRRYMVAVVGAHGIERDKFPLLSLAIAETGPERAVMVGDHPDDISAASRAGIPGVGVAWGFGRVADLVRTGAAAIADTPADLPAAVGSAWDVAPHVST